jgi:HSP20 family protein
MSTSPEWRPFRELDRFRRDFETLLERLHGDLREAQDGGLMSPRMDYFIEDDRLTIRLEMPGIDPKDLEVHASGGILTVCARREEKVEEKKRRFIRHECGYHGFERMIALPEGVDAKDLRAEFHDGVLELSAPMPKAAPPEKLKIPINGKHSGGDNGSTRAKPQT